MFKRQFDAMLIGLNNTVNLCPTSRTYAPPPRVVNQAYSAVPGFPPMEYASDPIRGWLVTSTYTHAVIAQAGTSL